MNLSSFINGTVISGIAQYLLGILGTYLATHAGVGASDWTSISGDLLAIIGVIWKVASSSGHAVQAAAVANSGQSVVGASPATAKLVPAKSISGV